MRSRHVNGFYSAVLMPEEGQHNFSTFARPIATSTKKSKQHADVHVSRSKECVLYK